MKKVWVRREIYKKLSTGHPWCFKKSIEKTEKDIENGELCELFLQDKFVGIGYYNSNTEIAFRLLTRKKEKIDTKFFINRFLSLKNNKGNFIKNSDSYRLVYAESDNIPGLIVDKYCNVLVIQINTAGIEKLKKYILEALIEILKPEAIYERSESGLRSKEGLSEKNKIKLYGKEIKEVQIIENGFKFIIDVLEGQKTGFFLDQRENRNSIIPFCKQKKVLNCFCYTGGFSIYAASVAKEVTSVDIASPALQFARKNFFINGFDPDKYEFIESDVFKYLKDIPKNYFDVIILDPPSLARNKSQTENALKAYLTLNSKAIEKLPNNGILVTSSCTAFVDEANFIQILTQSSQKIGCQLNMLKSNIQPPDHPFNLSFPEGRYLKFFILQKFPL